RAHGQALTVPAEESEERGEENGGDHEHEHALIAYARGPDLEDAAHEGRHLAVVAATDGEEGGLHEGGEPERQHEIERAGGTAPEPAGWRGGGGPEDGGAPRGGRRGRRRPRRGRRGGGGAPRRRRECSRPPRRTRREPR